MLNNSHVQVLAVEASAILLIGCITFAVMWARTLSQAPRARAFLSDIRKLEVGKSTFEDARMLAQRYGGIPWWVSCDSMRCTSQRCQFRFVFENKPLSSMYIEPHVGFVSGIEVRTGIPYTTLQVTITMSRRSSSLGGPDLATRGCEGRAALLHR